jgi:hypothetical protein
MATANPTTTLDARDRARFARKTFTATTGCIEWVGARSKSSAGYGQFWLDGRLRPAHRVAWEDRHGPIPDGLVCDHLCRNMRCVNTDHIRIVTVSENTTCGIGPAAVNAAKERCINGHAFSKQRTTKVGGRVCVECRRARDVIYRDRRRVLPKKSPAEVARNAAAARWNKQRARVGTLGDPVEVKS